MIRLLATVRDTDFFLILIVSIGIILLFVTTVLSILYISINRKNNYQIKIRNLQNEFEKELLKSTVEIQEQTLNQLSSEIHDNICQVLSFVKLNLNIIRLQDTDTDNTQRVNDSKEQISKVIYDLRDLSKSLSLDYMMKLGLQEAIQFEVTRINKNKIADINLITIGPTRKLGEKRELVLFRIFQESVNNALKHGKPSHLEVLLDYTEPNFKLSVADNGEGFDMGNVPGEAGLGLSNMRNRALLIGAELTVTSHLNEGCIITVSISQSQPEAINSGQINFHL